MPHQSFSRRWARVEGTERQSGIGHERVKTEIPALSRRVEKSAG